MRHTAKIALVALALAGAPLGATISPAAAADELNVQINPGGVAFGYSDGYWDRDHHWHNWRNAEDSSWWRTHNRDHYYAKRHDEEKDGGWRADQWWQHR